MDNLQSELAELRSFIVDLKADRAATKEKERKESWTKYASLSIVFIAVITAFASQYGGKYSSQTLVQLNESTFNQAKASDQWSFYQAKSIKQNLYETARDNIAQDSTDPAVQANLTAIKAKIARYEKEKEGIKADAEKLEKARDEARLKATLSSERGGKMGGIIAILQIAIALGSVCMLTKKKPLWFISMATAAAAAVRMYMIINS